jgi:hypothetical protein
MTVSGLRRNVLVLAGAAWLTVGFAAAQAHPDPSGDTIGVGLPQVDLLDLVADGRGSQLQLSLRLDSPAAAATAVGLVEIDTDRSIATGAVSRISFLCPAPVGLGVERTVDLFNRVGDRAPILDAADQPVGDVTVGFAGSVLWLAIPKAALGLEEGTIDVAAVVGPPGEATDCLPDGAVDRATVILGPGLATVEIPTLSVGSLAALALLLATAGALWLTGRLGR